jgi:carbon storage regulator CsrA
VRLFFLIRNESVIIDDYISVTVFDIDEDEVMLAIDAPEWIDIREKETLCETELDDF